MVTHKSILVICRTWIHPGIHHTTPSTLDVHTSVTHEIIVAWVVSTYTFFYSLQRTATRCNTLQRITLQHTATRCNTLQHAATRCNTLQHAATRCNSLFRNRTSNVGSLFGATTASHRNTLQHTASQCHTLQHTATHSITLQQSWLEENQQFKKPQCLIQE